MGGFNFRVKSGHLTIMELKVLLFSDSVKQLWNYNPKYGDCDFTF